MNVSRHIACTTPLAAAIAAASPLAGSLFWAGGVLIDADHYFDHIAVNRNWNPARAYRWHLALAQWILGRPHHRVLLVFHTVESFALMAAFATAFPVLWPFLAGMLFHLFLDKAHDFQEGLPWVRAVSIFQWLSWARGRESLAPTQETLDMPDARVPAEDEEKIPAGAGNGPRQPQPWKT